MDRPKALLPILVALLTQWGCTYPVAPPQMPEITFAHRPAIGLNVAEVQVQSSYTAPLAPPNVEHKVPVSPEQAMKQWAEDRLAARGRNGFARFTVLNGAVVETPLPIDRGVGGIFTYEQAERYDATAEAVLEIYDERGNRLAAVRTKAERARTIQEGATLNERDRTWFDLVDKLMLNFDAEMERGVRTHLGAWSM